MTLSVEELRNVSPQMSISIDLQFHRKKNGSYTEFVSLINRAIDYSSREMAKDKNILKGMSEDQLTKLLLTPLKVMTFDAEHARNIGGNCDISVKGPFDMLWLGEAKKFTSYDKILGGFQQLTDRYSTGLSGQDHGALIIYMTTGNAVQRMSEWKDYLGQYNSSATIHFDPALPLEFTSKTLHAGSGLPINVRHIPVVIYHEPTDPHKRPKRKKVGPKKGPKNFKCVMHNTA